MEDLGPKLLTYWGMNNLCLGKKLAESIVKEKLAACVNRVPGMHFLILSLSTQH
jgi:uncharacterized protein involved in tolerance to divalent cations